METKNGETGVVSLLEVVGRGFLAVDEVWVEDVELVALGERKGKRNQQIQSRQ